MTTATRRRFKSPYWDVPPADFQHVKAEEYKAMQAAGQVPQTVVNPSSQHLQGTKFANPSVADPMTAVRAAAAIINATIGAKSGGPKSSAPASTRQARRLYVGNIPFGCTEEELIEFFRANLDGCNFLQEPGNPVLACQINLNKNFAFIEFRTIEETSAAISLDGIQCKGQPLKIRRPHDYQPISGSKEQLPAPMLNSHNHMPPVQIQVPGLPPATSITPRVMTEVLCLMNMVEPNELRDDEEYREILEDIEEECTKYGSVRSIVIPRPSKRHNPSRNEEDDYEDPVPGLGKVFVEFSSPTEAQRAQMALAGRRFANRVVVTSCFDRERYLNREF